MNDYRKYLDPQTLAKVQNLDLAARQIVEGYVSGSHKSPFHGFSAEFAQHREYATGDDLRYVDWKVYAKSDRYYLKQYEAETNFTCYLLLDCSESMRYRSENAALSKWDYGRLVAAALAYVVIKQQDAAGLCTINNQIVDFLRPASQPTHLKQIHYTLEHTEPAGESGLGNVFHELAERISRRSLIIIISDLFDDLDSIMLGLKHFRHRKHDVSLLQVIDPAEQDFPFQEPVLFRGLENQPEQMAEPRSLKKAYQAEFEKFLKNVQRGSRDLKMDYALIRTDESLDIALSAFLSHRQTRIGS
ncbi:MAG: DUF58 domain-containing protein [Planctomycetes bacterium]|nr:DUF58 domain-containing protein [Planctomycetota bacterium]MCH9724991.1 DUF58 domain-containing protein [Planctomycetota bacterium]MCH9777548.1 DUF58 domain-containing protein [Planctomycetota bacterium]MCH9790215.1 DUF58 domain-containing protein [Planctomycetota bacterium]MDF1742518.1 DUF58 domain-containing protein [Gimesia sp.]